MEAILSRAKQVAEAAEVYSLSVEETPVVFEANRLKHLLTRQRRLLVLRLIRQGRIGFALSSGGGDGEGLVERAVAVAKFGARATFDFPASLPPPPVPVYDPEVKEVKLEEMVGLGETMIEQVRRQAAEVQCEARVSKATAHIRLINSRGGEVDYHKSYFGMNLEGVLVRGTDMLFVGDSQSSCHPLRDTSPVVSSTIGQLERAQRLARLPTGTMPVILTPLGAHSVLLPPLSMGFNGKMVLQGASPLKGKLGELAFSADFSLWDDATLPFEPGSRPWDDEGVPTRRTPLVEKGTVATFFYDLHTASLAGTQSTGNASREGRGNPLPTPWALVIGPGQATQEEMMATIQQGLMVEGLIGAEQGNVLGGDFSGNVLLGYKIEEGEVVGRVKDTMISGNIYQALREGMVVGKEGRWVGSRFFAPPLYFPRLAVASKG